MNEVRNFRNIGCKACLNGSELGFDFSMAFQPIVDVSSKTVFAQEALVRGIGGLPAGEVFKHVSEDNLYAFDQACRVRAINLASKLHITSFLSINFMPNAVYRPELCIRTTLAAAEEFNFPVSRIMFEVTESEKVGDVPHLQSIINHYKQKGFITALDDFGAGYSGLNTLADLEVDVLKVDMYLARDINANARKQAIVKGIVATCQDLGVKIIAEGVETHDEYTTLRACGIKLFQGYYFARPAYEALADIAWDDL